MEGSIKISGKISYVSQIAWIQNGTIQENILFGSAMDSERYGEILEKCSLVKDLELLPYGDLTEIGERGVNLSGGQKQRVQLARALYQNADIFLLDDPFSALDAQTATSLFNEYFLGALSEKTVLLVTHQVDFLPAFDSVLLMSDGKILQEGPYHGLLASSKEFQDLVNAHKETAGSERFALLNSSHTCGTSSGETRKNYEEKQCKAHEGDQLIKQEEREKGDTGFKPYMQYLNQNKGFLYFSIASVSHLIVAIGQILQNSWMAANVDDPHVSTLRLVLVYLLIGLAAILFLLSRSLCTVVSGLKSSESLFAQLLSSLFHAPMSFYDSTPLGRILSRVSSDLSTIDLDVPFGLLFSVSSINVCSALLVLAVVTWQVLIVSIPMIFLSIRLQFAANEWLIQWIEIVSATVLSSAALCMVLLPSRTFSSGEYTIRVRYRPNTPLVLCGISCTFEGGHKIGIVGRTGSGKTTLIGALFRLVEPAAGKITVDGIDISTIGLHDLRSRLGIIPQDPTLFNGTVRYNLDPLSRYSDQEIWEVIGKSQLQEALQEKGKGLESLVVGDGSNWSVGQRQLFCLGRVLLRRSRILVLDEATASIDNATDMILQKTIRSEFADRTVITVAHRIPTVMDCNMVLAISDGKLMEYDTPTTLMKRKDSLFGQLVKEYWSHSHSTEPY
ncbi:ABC transporter C family member 10 [Morella rubra]|uniref:ABC-type xenobiotic transporter n=1 Tax=Morella rubra TaxID=262757 RepID=A0A6A1UWY2_9ROSI|nr:ABC transporter C family member 10 [Morella rubra]